MQCMYQLRNLESRMMDLLEEEEKLAGMLRKLCAPFGDERKSSLSQSTDILYQMGEIYTKKAEITEDNMEQKLHFIKAATLLHAARVRSEKVLEMIWISEKIHKAITKMERILMTKCCGHLPIPLSAFSCHVLASFESLRAEEKMTLDSLEVIEESKDEEEVQKKFDLKIEVIRGLLQSNSDNYKRQLQEIATKVFEYIGPPPCDFAIAGLGSLARDEVTLYSDFEHVIILEEGVQKRADYVESVLEYFRWFSVIFHIIMIGIGETIIPSIGIETLNNLYTSDKSKNWFYDSFTPPGVSFDGMMPHACKIPLGRLKKTKNKDFVIELIKPVSEMALYLTMQEDIKNGYHLKDVLQETCFVFGSEAVYSEFKAKSDEQLRIDRDEVSSYVAYAVREDVTPYFTGVASCLRNSRTYSVPLNPKSAFYRPFSLLISCLGQMRDTKCKSGFDNLAEFEDVELNPFRKSFMKAFACACETRLKGYAEEHSSRKKNFANEIARYIGGPGLSICVSTIVSLSDALRGRRFAKEGGIDITQFGKFGALLLRGKLNDALRQNLVDSFTLVTELHKFWVFLFDVKKLFMTDINKIQYNEKYAPLENAEMLCEKLKDRDCYSDLCLLLSTCYFYNGEFPKVIKYALAASEDIEGKPRKSLSVENFLYQTNMLFLSMEPTKFVEYCKNRSSGSTNLVEQLLLGYYVAATQCGTGQKREGKMSLKKVTTMCLSELIKINDDSFVFVMLLIQWCFLQQRDEGWKDDAVETLDVLGMMSESGRLHIDPDNIGSKQHSFYAAWTYITAVTEQTPTYRAINLYNKGLRNCRLREELQGYQQLYRFIIKVLIVDCNKRNSLAMKSFLDEVFSDAPKIIKKDKRVKTVLVTYLLFWFRELLTDTDPLKISHLATCYCRMMGTLHPIFYPFAQRLVFLVRKRVAEMLLLPENPCKLLENLLSEVTDKPDVLGAENNQDICKEIRELWRNLHQEHTASTRDDCVRFLGNVHGFICVNATRRFGRMVQDLTCVKPLVRQEYQRSQFSNALSLYKELSLVEAIQKFWRCMNMKGTTYDFRRLSIAFFCNATLLCLFFAQGKNLFADADKLQITAITHDDSTKGKIIINKLCSLSDTPPETLVVENNPAEYSSDPKFLLNRDAVMSAAGIGSPHPKTQERSSCLAPNRLEALLLQDDQDHKSEKLDAMLMLGNNPKKYVYPEKPPEILFPNFKLRENLHQKLSTLRRAGLLGLFSEPP